MAVTGTALIIGAAVSAVSAVAGGVMSYMRGSHQPGWHDNRLMLLLNKLCMPEIWQHETNK